MEADVMVDILGIGFVSGGGRYVVELADGMRELGHKVAQGWGGTVSHVETVDGMVLRVEPSGAAEGYGDMVIYTESSPRLEDMPPRVAREDTYVFEQATREAVSQLEQLLREVLDEATGENEADLAELKEIVKELGDRVRR